MSNQIIFPWFAGNTSRLKDFENKVKKLEEDLRKSEAVRKDLQENLNEIERERDEELKIVQDVKINFLFKIL